MIKSQTYISRDPGDTFAFGRVFASSLHGGEVLALYGDLGSGKTAFVQGLAAGLGVKQTVNSPTFPIMNIYTVKNGKVKRLCHIDTYRLASGGELSEIGAIDYVGAFDTVTAIEWAEKAESLMPKEIVKIQFEVIGENERKITIVAK
ncbi:tRNA (adenosine(37)-N6)-threonylcarbamoyltransferase complex ATPase subunit type 1 TsaE [Candidatus Falkowbacteria bacterium HGW-Falkowbacteria-2]|uniref:tRNA threonylcarbamoyladenosine biosynthesis protein TsaE n=1 Tax=Candidatus Falkowbacteria bacterium HGW-Falkowbacteria-2 TaxID=2013769 RepID=A0A2N2DWZ0_9BACT|nr:MAG: tRNA (adenosine(37)-N6)-threonylcarbamoyltransferase complex ATPase subunit type 1 TsaE [Candidatus Falkowbacteria bacterium HGW-Falkowbacteria-2]